MPFSIHINLPLPSIHIDLTPKPVKAPAAPSMDDVRAGRRTLSRGMEGPAVAELQKRIGLPVTGKFDALTERTVRGYQQKFGLTVDGVVGKQTLSSLDRKLPPVDVMAPVKPAPVVLTPPPPPAAPTGTTSSPAVVAPPAPPPPAFAEIH